MTNPLFSVIVPLFNHEHYVGEAIRSVLRQSVTDLELIIIDDGSTDNSAQVVESFEDPRIHYQYQENCGAHYALNRGLAMANGTFLAILNSDDAFHPDRLRHAQEAFEANPGLEAFFSAYHYMDDTSTIIREAAEILKNVKFPLPSAASAKDAIVAESDEWVLTLLSGNVFHTTSNLIVRSSAFERVGPFRSWRYVHDYDFFLRLCASSRIYFDERPLLNYRFHGHNTLAENATRSVQETILVIAEFLAGWRPKAKASESGIPFKYFRHFLQDLRLYGGDRFLLALILTESLFREEGPIEKGALIRFLGGDDAVAQLVKADLQESVEYDQINDRLNWQKTETDNWWRRSQELESELIWQREQTDRWWQRSQELEVELTWQKEQTDHWWRKSQEMESGLASQREQTDHWKQEAQEAHQKLDAVLIEANRLLGIPNVKENFKRRLTSIFNKEDSE